MNPTPDQKGFENFLGWLDADRNTAAEKYSNIYLKLKRFFEWNSCHAPEECANETFDIIGNKVEEGYVIHDQHGEIIKNKLGYIFGVARNVRNKDWHQQSERPISLQDVDEPSCDDLTKAKIEGDCQKFCLEELQKTHEDEWCLLYDYYQEGAGVDEWRRGRMARRLRISRNALTIRIGRIKDKLWQQFQACIKECIKKSNFV
ncbi:hypothetical protein MUP77_20785 [Candidatus Bathyarchaeota archaeon]|nr:hypothetical protein [Candidatus Bathyarchaeota archaeon]